jgi:hypothetical protein
LEEAIASDVVTLRKEEICFIPCIDVRDAPSVSEDLDWLDETG